MMRRQRKRKQRRLRRKRETMECTRKRRMLESERSGSSSLSLSLPLLPQLNNYNNISRKFLHAVSIACPASNTYPSAYSKDAHNSAYLHNSNITSNALEDMPTKRTSRRTIMRKKDKHSNQINNQYKLYLIQQN